MSAAVRPLEVAGWRLFCELPPEIADHRDALIRCVTTAAAGQLVEPMRRSRYATTFRVRFGADANSGVDLFVKVIQAPRGARRFKRLFRRSPARNAAQAAWWLARAGLHAPPVWIYGSQRASGCEMIAAPRAEGDGPLRTLAALTGAPTAKRAILRALGAEVARLHRSGFVHGDLTPFNIFIVRGEPPSFVLLDHERTCRGLRLGRPRRQLRNLVQLGRFGLPGVTRSDRMRVLLAYVLAMRPRDQRRFTRRINAMLVGRLRRDGGFQKVEPVPQWMTLPGAGV